MEHLTLEQLRLTHSDKQPAAPPAGSPAPERTGSPNFRKGGQAAAQSGAKDHQHGSDYATPENTKLLREMLAERAGDPRTDAVRVRLNEALDADPNRRLTKYHFRNFFRDLKAITRTDKPAQTVHALPKKGFMPRPNKFPGDCAECGRKVGEGEGLLIGKDDHGDWAVSHKPGECQPSDFPFPFGRYALEEADGTVKFYVAREHTDDQDGGLFAQASDDLFPITNKDNRDAIIARIAEDPKAAAIRYGLELEVCGRCGRTLTSEWRKVGIGPVCAEKAW